MAIMPDRSLATAVSTPVDALPPLPFCLPGVYQPQADTQLLVSVVAAEPVSAGSRALDVGAGTGAVALTAALAGWAHVTATDISRRAVVSTRLNAWHLGLSVRARRMSFMELPVLQPFDLVVANPPYVPCAAEGKPAGRTRAWDAGRDGRAVLDPLCAIASRLLTPSGCLLLVQSDVSGVEATLEQLRAGDLRARVVASRRTTFGPVMHARVGFLEDTGLITAGRRHENLVVIRAEKG